ncbi:MAG: dihydrodipicolinate synthase family protein [Verrucomicrobiota bacterium]
MKRSPMTEGHHLLKGLVAATFTPLKETGELNLDLFPAMVDHLAGNGIQGIYICGSTGEGPSLTIEERKLVAEAFLDAARDRLKTIIHIGHCSLPDCETLARHAESHGADAISAIAPFYYKPLPLENLVEFLALAAGSSSLPFYYYHMPSLTGIPIDPLQLLELGSSRIPTLQGIKFTDSDLSILSECQDYQDGQYEVLFGRDEMLLSALALGNQGAVGSTYNLAPALYRRIIQHFEAGELEEARQAQRQSVKMIRSIMKHGGEAALKYPMHRFGLDCGQRRLPMNQLSPEQKQAIDATLDTMEFDNWASDISA